MIIYTPEEAITAVTYAGRLPESGGEVFITDSGEILDVPKQTHPWNPGKDGFRVLLDDQGYYALRVRAGDE